MAKATAHLNSARGIPGPGRPKGALNKRTLAQREWAIALLESEEYRESARRRILSGRAPHLEGLFHEATILPRKSSVTHDGEIIVRCELPDDAPSE